MLRSGAKLRQHVTLPEVVSIGVSIWDSIWALEAHQSQAHELVHVVKGSVRVHIDKGVYAAKQGDTIFVPARALHRDDFPLEAPFEALLIQFAWEADRWLLAPSENECLLGLPLRVRSAIGKRAREVYDAFRKGLPQGSDVVQALLYALLVTIASEVRTHARAAESGMARAKAGKHFRQTHLFERACRYVDENLKEQISLNDVAQHLGLSSYHLSHVFSQTSGFSLSNYIGRKRMERAAALLTEPNHRVSDVAYAVGYADPNHFAKAFRRFHGASPSQYRERQLSWKGRPTDE